MWTSWRRSSTPPLDVDPGPSAPLTIERVLGPNVDCTRLDRLHDEVFGDTLRGDGAFEGDDRARQRSRVVVARRESFWVAYAVAERSVDDRSPDLWHLLLVGVRPGEQRRGHGLAVSEEMLSWLAVDEATVVLAKALGPGGQRLLDALRFSPDSPWGLPARHLR